MQSVKIILKKEASLTTSSGYSNTTFFEGYLLKVSVVSATGITPKVFVMQRDVASNYTSGFMDTFYSIASVGELEWIPEDAPGEDTNDTNFFRTDSISLMFETPEERENGWAKIKFDIAALQRAKEDSEEIDSTSFEIFPSKILFRYYGASATEIDATNLATLDYDNKNNVEFTFAIDTTADSHIYYAGVKEFSEDLGFRIGETVIAMETSEIVVTMVDGSQWDYLLYKSEQEFAPLSATIEVFVPEDAE